jgi:hypothetical protein
MKVGDYVRTKKGIIARCIEEKADRYIFDRIIIEEGYYHNYEYKDINNKCSCIIKSSPYIIDIIEVGDIIITNNLCGEVTKIDGDKIWTTCYDGEYCYEYHIDSIITKEQVAEMAYRINR